jgi:hypothetical protein
MSRLPMFSAVAGIAAIVAGVQLFGHQATPAPHPPAFITQPAVAAAPQQALTAADAVATAEAELAAEGYVEPLPADQPGATLTNFLRLRSGMSQGEVTAILGSPGTLLSANTLGDLRTALYSWTGDDGGTLHVMFQDNALVSQAQFGLGL